MRLAMGRLSVLVGKRFARHRWTIPVGSLLILTGSGASFLGCSGDNTPSESFPEINLENTGGTPPDGGNTDPEIGVDGLDRGTGGMGGMVDMTEWGNCNMQLELVVRDFNSDHPDMERQHPGRNEVGCGMVLPDLLVGADGTRTPVFFGPIGTGRRDIVDETISCVNWGPMAQPPLVNEYEIESEDSFNQWFSDVEGVNSTFVVSLPLSMQDEGTWYYDSDESEQTAFFIADGLGFDEVSNGHNYHFTTEAHVQFKYHAGDHFTFSGDDDLWIFINDKLALDLGGLHGPLRATIDFDAQAEELGIAPGGIYNMDIFHAERHLWDSNYRIETNINCLKKVVVPTEVIR